jgi:hypothetical protein
MKAIIIFDNTVSCDEIVMAFENNPAVLSIEIEGEHCGACTKKGTPLNVREKKKETKK